MTDFKRFLITTALPYANGPIHIGHLAGVYVPADIYVRYLRLKGEEVIWVCGSDEHGVPITIKARNEGISPQQVVDKYNAIIKQSFADFGISFDIYSRTTSPIHYETASGFFKELHDKGCFIEKTTEQFYDTSVGQFLADRYITGTCPHCQNENAYGDQCEKCGTSLNATDLINPRSALSGNPPEMRETRHWFLPLDRYSDFLKNWILEEHKDWKPNVYGQCKSWLDLGLQPRAVSRDLDWGVPVPLSDAAGKVLYVWFDAPIGYISATKELTSEWEKYWKDPETRLIHFIGKDNIVFHCIVFPAMLKAQGSFILPDNVPANEFLNLEGDKISTSRNWAVWLHEYLNDFKGKEDVLRYVLTANAPETKDNDFTWKDFQARNNNELVAVFGNFVNRALVLTHMYFDGKIPEPTSFNDYDKQVISQLSHIPRQTEESLQHFRFREALKNAMEMARLGNKYLADTEPWKLIKQEPERVATILNISLQIVANLSILMEPFLPFTTKKLRCLLSIHSISWSKLGHIDLLMPGHKLNEPVLLFDKIEDHEIQIQTDKLLATKNANQGNSYIPLEIKPDISFDDFSRLDIRIGTIVDAEKVPKTKKLLRLTVDSGIDQRTIVSGIADYFEPEKVIGKKVAFVANLAPREIKGIESKGMILMAENFDGELSFISPENQFVNGSIIK